MECFTIAITRVEISSGLSLNSLQEYNLTGVNKIWKTGSKVSQRQKENTPFDVGNKIFSQSFTDRL